MCEICQTLHGNYLYSFEFLSCVQLCVCVHVHTHMYVCVLEESEDKMRCCIFTL